MAVSTTTKSATSGNIAAGATKTFTIAAFTVPDGCTINRFKVALNVLNSNLQFRPIADGLSAPAKDTWYTYSAANAQMIGWTDGSTSKAVVKNSSSGNLSCNVTITFEYKLDKVVAGDKIYSYDRSKTGTSTSSNSVMTDSNFSSGTKIEASTFNTAYGL